MALKDGYLKLITSEHSLRPKFNAMVSKLLDYTDPSMELCLSMHSAFDIDYAVGVQLDTLGDYLGKTRRLIYNPAQGESSILNDDIYRILLKATILRNTWRGGIMDLYESWAELLPDIKLSIRDNQDMTIDVTIVGKLPTQLQELIRRGYIVPKPQGVRVNVQINKGPIFAYELDNNEFSGYDKGTWGD